MIFENNEKFGKYKTRVICCIGIDEFLIFQDSHHCKQRIAIDGFIRYNDNNEESRVKYGALF